MQEYDYAACGVYFITISTKERECLLWDKAGAICDRPPPVSREYNQQIRKQRM